MNDYIKGFCLGLVIFSWGWMIWELYTEKKLPVVAENEGSCGSCGAKTVVTIRER